MVRQVMELFNLEIDKDLDIMKHGPLTHITNSVLTGLVEEFHELNQT